MAVEAHGLVIGIAESFVAAARHHHINPAQQGGQGFVALQAVKLINHYNLVHAHRQQGVHRPLQVVGDFFKVTRRLDAVVLDLGAVG